MAGTILRFFKEGLLHGKHLFCDPDYRDYCRLLSRYEKAPRFVERNIRIRDYSLIIPDVASFLSTYHEMFVERIYDFKTANPAPVIIDIGANIGLSILFFKAIYPAAKVYAYEADPYIFKFLQNNVGGINGVTLYNLAVWNCGTTMEFSSDHADGGRLGYNPGVITTISVATASIQELLKLHPSIDFLKIDIEGAENMVVPAAEPWLDRVKNIFVEYHSAKDRKQELALILNILEKAGFRLFIQSVDTPNAPLRADFKGKNFDMQLNIWGKKHV